MPSEMRTTSPHFPHDMTPWCHEKMRNVVSSLAHHVQALRELEKILGPIQAETPGSDYQINAWEGLGSALYDATKVFSYFCEAPWATTDRDLIIEKGYEGYEELAVKYGVLQKTTRQRDEENYLEFMKRLRVLLKGPRSPNRTELHELIRMHPKSSQHKTIQAISDSLEEVTMGRLDWDTFTATSIHLLDDASL
jgi:hypothetical protein